MWSAPRMDRFTRLSRSLTAHLSYGFSLPDRVL